MAWLVADAYASRLCLCLSHVCEPGFNFLLNLSSANFACKFNFRKFFKSKTSLLDGDCLMLKKTVFSYIVNFNSINYRSVIAKI